ncbi:MAG: hypothetical protein A2176_15235 [Spirochaetes bacterium RBG_13_51_14]|nr:MAG: hypothetical protein A2176_15235 [Spirochaetes bacterium RBG_13_51_14]
MAAIAPRYQSLKASNDLQERIMRSWREIRNGDVNAEPNGIRSLLVKHRRTAIASAAFAVAGIILIVTIFMQGPLETRRGSMVMNRMDAGVTVNGIPARNGEAVYDASMIRLPEMAIAQLVYDDTIKITLINNNDFSIDNFIIEKALNVKLGLTLRDGMLLSAIHGRQTTIKYEYRTPNARIEPLGTEFLLQTEDGVTLVIMKEGAIKVTHIRSGKSETVPSGRKCIISDSFACMPTTKEDMKIFDDLDKLRNGSYAHLLLPAIYDLKVRAKTGNRDTGDIGKEKNNKKNDIQNEGEDTRNDTIEKQNSRVDRDRERMQQRMEQKKMQMNEMRRNNKTNMNQQMRRGR